MLPSEAISKLLEDTFAAVEEWARESKKNLNEAQGEGTDETESEAQAAGSSTDSANTDPFVEFIGAFKDAEEQMLRIQSATLRATQAFVETLKTELEPRGTPTGTTSESEED